MHALVAHVLDQGRRVALVLVGPEEVAAHVIGGLLLHRLGQRAHELVRLQVAGRALPDGVRPLLDPALEHRRLVAGGDVDRRVDRQVVLVDLLGVDLARALLERHAGGAREQRRHGVPVLGHEQVVGVVVEVGDALVVERLADRRPDQVADEVDREVGDLVVDGVLVGREEVAVARLVGVDVEDAGVLLEQRQERAVLDLVLRAEVAVVVERPRARARDRVAPVRVAHRQQEVVHVLQAPRVPAVRPGRQLVEVARDRLAGRRLGAVRRGGDPRQRGPRAGGGKAGGLGHRPVTHAGPERAVAAARVEVGDVVRRAQDVELQRPAEHRGAERLDQHPHAGGRLRRGEHRVEVLVDVRGEVAAGAARRALAQRAPDDVGELRDRRVVGDRVRAAGGVDGRDPAGRREDGQQRGDGDAQRRGAGERHGQRGHQRNLRVSRTGAKTDVPRNRTLAL